MARKDASAALADACAQKKSVSQLERIANGESVWFHGCPVIADPGTFALDTGSGRIVIIDRKDVRSVEQMDEMFLVEVPAGTNVIARLESVVSVDPETCSCAGEEISRPGADKIALQVGQDDATHDPFNVLEYCWNVQRWVRVCDWVKVSPCRVLRVCSLELRTVWICRSDRHPGPHI